MYNNDSRLSRKSMVITIIILYNYYSKKKIETLKVFPLFTTSSSIILESCGGVLYKNFNT